MIRAVMPGRDGTQVVLLGMTPENVEAMGEGHPVAIPLAEFGDVLETTPASKVVFSIMLGDTYEAILLQLQADGVQQPPVALEQARAMDDRLRRERAERASRDG